MCCHAETAATVASLIGRAPTPLAAGLRAALN